MDVPKPTVEAGEVLIRVHGSGVCATDVKILGGGSPPRKLPTILGHEVAGTIEEIGEGVAGLTLGQRVAVYPIAACGDCFYCRQGKQSLCLHEHGLGHGYDGGFAEYVLIPHEIINLDGIIDIGDMPYDLAAMIEPTSCCISAAEQCGSKAGDTVVVIGCGPLGLLHTIVSSARDAQVIAIDMNVERLATAQTLGAEVAINPKLVDPITEVRRLTEIGADVVIAAVGIPKVIEQYLPLVRNGGVFNIFGGTPRGEMMTIDPRWLHYGEVNLTGTFAASVAHFKQAHQFVQQEADRIEQVISTRCALDDVLNAVDRVKRGEGTKSIIVFE